MSEENNNKILIIEDDIPLQNAYKSALKKENFELYFSITGKEGIQIAKKQKPDLIVLDLMLPGGMNGFDVLEQLSSDDDLKNIPVFVLTNLDAEQESAIKVGANKYFVKTNISIDQIINEIKTELKK